ncbi:hypothetical protein Tco_0583446 [Tanacetum coccineum]
MPSPISIYSMSDFNELYDVKVYVRSSVKLLSEIKLLLQTNPTRERIFERTVFGPWLDISSHDNDNHLMHCVLQHRVHVSKIPSDATPIIFHIGDHWDKKGWLALSDMDAIKVCLLIVVELVFMGQEDMNCIPKHIVSLVEDLDVWNDYPWGEYMWDKFYKRTINVVARHRDHHLAEKKKNLNFNATYNLYDFAWAFKIWILETYPNSKIWWSKNENVLPRGLAWTKISKFEKSDYNRLFRPVSIPNVDLYSTPAEQREPWFIASIPFINGLVDEDRNVFMDDCVGVSKDNDVDGQHQLGYENERVNETLVEKNDRLLLEEGDGVLDSERGGRNHESDNVKQPENVSIAELFAKVHALRQEVALIKVHDGRIANVERLLKEKLQNDFATLKTKPDMISNHSKDIRNCCVPDVTSNHTSVDQGLDGSANDPMSACSRPDMDNAKFACDGMSIDKADRKNEYTYSQANTSTLDILIKAFDYSNDHPEIDVLRDANDVHSSVPNLNHHATPEPVHVYDFADDYMNVLNDEETVPNYSLDDMKLQDEEDNLTVKEILVEHQPVDELIDVQKDKTTLLQENVKDQSNKPKYVNVVKDDYKPPLASVFTCAKSKTKKCGIRKNYVLRSVEERMNKLVMALDSPFGQQGTATPAPPKTRSMSSIGDTIVAPDFVENSNGILTVLLYQSEVHLFNILLQEISGQPKMRSPNELMTIQEFVEDIVVGRIFWLMLACLDKAKEGWLQDSHLDLWVDLMWYFIEPDADWAMVSPHFLPCIIGGSMPDYYSKGVRYPVSWQDVEKKTMIENNEEKIATTAYLVSKRAWGFIEQGNIS